ncbi:MAG: ABC transporter permease [Actinobacteria bacterium]|nr:ABC transporter permease [Actinomycetota bacterium]MBO0784532.1 ABC transporter permease [Actinomycetota bacterium]
MRFLTALGNEVRKGLLFAWSERLQIALELPFFTLFILLLGPMLGAGHQIAAGHLHWTLDSHRIALLLVAFLPAMFFYFQAVKLFWRLLAEIQAGTIEQVYLSPLPSWLVAAAGRLAAAIIETVILTAGTYGLVSAFVTLRFHWTAAALVPMAFLMLSGVGYSLIIAGMTLAWKRIQLLQETFLMLVMVFAVSALPLLAVPGWFAGLGRLFPVTADVASLYGVMLTRRSVTAPWGTGGLVWVIVTAAAYLAAGLAVFRVLERATKARGTLGAY